MPPNVTTLSDTALSACLGAIASSLLAVAAAAVLVALEELALRRLTNYLSIWSWLARQSDALRSQAPWVVKLLSRSSGGAEDERSVALQARVTELAVRVAEGSAGTTVPRAAAPLGDGAGTEGPGADGKTAAGPHAAMVKVLFDVIGAGIALPARQLLGVLSATIQADASQRQPSEFVRWIAAIGSLPVTPSPFAAIPLATPPAPSRSQTDDSEERVEPRQPEEATGDVPDGELQVLVQGQADRALDSLQMHLASGWRLARYGAALLIVWFLNGALTNSLPPYRGLSHLTPDYAWQLFVGSSPNMAVWFTATALVPVFMALVERLAGRGR